MPSPLLNLAAESGFCEFVKVLIDDGKVRYLYGDMGPK